MNYLTMGISALALGASLAAGYRLGTLRLESCRNDLNNIVTTQAKADALAKDTQAQMQRRQADLEKESQAKLEATTSKFAEERNALQRELGQAGERIKVLQGKTVTTDSDLARVRQEIKALGTGNNNAQLRQQLQDKERELVAARAQLVAQTTSLVCLDAAVPSEQITRLNRSPAEMGLESKP